MGYKARHPTANFYFFDYFFCFHKKNPFALFIFFFQPTRKKRRQRIHTNYPHHTISTLFISFCVVYSDPPVDIIRVEESSRTPQTCSYHRTAERSRFVFFRRRSYFTHEIRFCPSAPPSKRTSFWVRVFFFFYQPTYYFVNACSTSSKNIIYFSLLDGTF